MKTKLFKSQLTELKLVLGLLVLVVLALMSYIYFNHQSIAKFKTDEKIVLVPYNINGEFWVKDNDFSDEYFIAMMETVEILYFDQTASNTTRNNRHLLKIISPTSYAKIKKHLKEKSGLLKRYPDTVFQFNTNSDVSINRGKQTLNRRGKLVRKGVGGKIINKAIMFNVGYQLEHGLFRVTSLKYEEI